ncbi:MAG: hypothetical protein HQK83_12280 [Fibrobacteria bacterium]|nr:hypothetical protein [Fibrobacteria bacterium]
MHKNIFSMGLIFALITFGFSGELDIKGRVIDKNSEPVVKALVTLVGVNRAVYTDDKGEFKIIPPVSLDAPSSAGVLQSAPVIKGGVLSFTLLSKQNLSAGVFDVQGRTLARINTKLLQKGHHSFSFLPMDLVSGMYIVKLRVGHNHFQKKYLYGANNGNNGFSQSSAELYLAKSAADSAKDSTEIDSIVVMKEGFFQVKIEITNFVDSLDDITLYSELDSTIVYDTRDGRVYKTVTIGTQRWMAENLDYAGGSPRCYMDDSANCEKMGSLYNWTNATADTHGNTRDICPVDWHMPSHGEWKILEQYLGISDSLIYHERVYGQDVYKQILAEEHGGTNETGLSLVISGSTNAVGAWIGTGQYWSINKDANDWCKVRFLRLDQPGIHSYVSRPWSFSAVRCIKDTDEWPK